MDFKRFQWIPRDSKRFQKVPKDSKDYKKFQITHMQKIFCTQSALNLEAASCKQLVLKRLMAPPLILLPPKNQRLRGARIAWAPKKLGKLNNLS